MAFQSPQSSFGNAPDLEGGLTPWQSRQVEAPVIPGFEGVIPGMKAGLIGSYDFETGVQVPGKLSDPNLTTWNPYEAIGPTSDYGGTGYANLWHQSPWAERGTELGRYSGPFASTAEGGVGDQFKVGADVGGISGRYYYDQIALDYGEYQDRVKEIVNSYYGPTTAETKDYALFGASATPYDPGFQDAQWAGPTDPTSTLGEFIKDYGGYRDDPNLYDFSANLYKTLGNFDTENMGAQVTTYINNRKAITEEYFGDAANIGETFHPDDPFATSIPTIEDATGASQEITIDSELGSIQEAIGKYGESSKQGQYLADLVQAKGQLDSLGYIDPSDAILGEAYGGLYAPQKEILEGLFGTGGTELDPVAGVNSLYAARSQINNIAQQFYTTGGPEQIVRDAFANVSLNEAGARSDYEDAVSAASGDFFGLSDIDIDVLQSAGFITGDYNNPQLGFDGSAYSATADDAFEGESEFSYELRKFMEEVSDGAPESGQYNTYLAKYDMAAETKSDNFIQLAENFGQDSDTISSEYAKGNIDLKTRMAAQKGLRTGMTKRIKDQLESNLAATYGTKKLDWRKDQSQEQEAFDLQMETIATSLVEAWNVGFGDEGNVDRAQQVRDTALGFELGNYVLADGTMLPFTEEQIMQILQDNNSPGDTVMIDTTGDGIPDTNVTIETTGNIGNAYMTYRDAKMGTWGTGDATVTGAEGYSPGEDRAFGGGDDEWYDPTDSRADEYGWVTGSMPSGMLETIGGLEAPTAAFDEPARFSASAYGGEAGAGIYKGEYEQKFGEGAIPDLSATTPTGVYGDIEQGEFGLAGEKGAEDEALLRAQLPGMREAAMGRGAGGTMEQVWAEEKKAVLGEVSNSLYQQGTDKENATIDNWTSAFNSVVGDFSLQKKLQMFGEAMGTKVSDFMNDMALQLEGSAPFANIFTADWVEGDDGKWSMVEVEEDTGNEEAIEETSEDSDNANLLIAGLAVVVLVYCWVADCGGGGGDDDDAGDESCFSAGTKIMMSDGSEKSIEDIKKGDKIIGYTGQINTVTDLQVTKLGSRTLYGFGEKGFFTIEHPFLTSDGWRAVDNKETLKENPSFKDLDKMQVGDKLFVGTKVEEGVSYIHRPIKNITRTNREEYSKDEIVYNVLCDGNHTYHADGFVVHTIQPSFDATYVSDGLNNLDDNDKMILMDAIQSSKSPGKLLKVLGNAWGTSVPIAIKQAMKGI